MKMRPCESVVTCGRNGDSRRRGVTLLEMLIVVTLVALLAGITYPAVSSGIDSVRLAGAADAVAAFLNQAMNRADRLQEVVEVEVLAGAGGLRMRSGAAGFERHLPLSEGVTVRSVVPEPPEQSGQGRRFYFYPGGAPPAFAIELANTRGRRRLVRIDPVAGVPEITDVAPEPPSTTRPKSGFVSGKR